MATFTGMGGTINGFSTVRTWSVSETEENKPYSAGNTLGGEGQVGGIKDWSGSHTLYGYSSSVMPGESFAFVGYDGAKIVTGTAIVSDITLAVNQESGDIQGITVSFSGNGALVHDEGTVTDSTIPNPPSSLSMKVKLDTGAGFVELDDVRSYNLSIKCDLKEYASSTSGGWKKRHPGKITASGSIEFYDQDVRTAPDLGTVAKLQLYVSDTLFWLIHWARFGQGDYQVSPEGADIASGTANWNWSGFDAGVVGTITKPGGTEFWPAA